MCFCHYLVKEFNSFGGGSFLSKKKWIAPSSLQHSSYTRDTQQDFFLYMEGLSDDLSIYLSIYLSIMLCPSTNRWYGLYSLHEKNKYISVKNNNLGISPLSYHQLLGWVGSGIYKINGNSIGHQPKRIDFMIVPVKINKVPYQ